MYFKVYLPAAAATSKWFADKCNSVIILKYTNMGVYLFIYKGLFLLFYDCGGEKRNKKTQAEATHKSKW